jgi:hypothetical protein
MAKRVPKEIKARKSFCIWTKKQYLLLGVVHKAEKGIHNKSIQCSVEGNPKI